MATVAKLNVKDFSPATLPGLNGNPDQHGWKLGGLWINGSTKYRDGADDDDASAILAAVVKEGVKNSNSNKSLVLGDFTGADVDRLKELAKLGVITKREVVPAFTLDEIL